jgi:hypothetical protein
MAASVIAGLLRDGFGPERTFPAGAMFAPPAMSGLPPSHRRFATLRNGTDDGP